MSSQDRVSRFLLFSLFIYLLPVVLGGFVPGMDKVLVPRYSLYLILFIFLGLSWQQSFRSELRGYFDKNGSGETYGLDKSFLLLTLVPLFLSAKVVSLNLYNFHVSDVDFSYFDLMISNFVQNGSWFTEACECDHMGVHSTYWFYLLAPFHWVFSSPYFLQMVHALALWAALFPIRLLAIQFGFSRRETLLIPIFFSAYTYFIHILRYNFHFEVFYLPFMLWMFHFFVQKRIFLFLVFGLFTLLVKEDAGFYLICFSFYVGFLEKRRREGIGLALLCLSVTAFSLKYYIPLHRGENYVIAGTATKYGASFTEIISNVLKDPFSLIRDIATGGWLKASLSLVFIPLLSLGFWVSCASLIFIHSIASSPFMNGMRLYYSAPFLPFLIYYFFVSIGRPRFNWVSKYRGHILVLTFFIGTLLGGGFVRFEYPKGESSNLSILLNHHIFDKSKICVQGSIIPHIGYDKEVTSLRFCKFEEIVYDYILINSNIETYPFSKAKVLDLEESFKSNSKYELDKFGNFLLFKAL